MKKFIGFIVLALWVIGGLLLAPGVSFAQFTPPGIQIFDDDVNGISFTTFGTFTGNPTRTQETATSPGSVIWNFFYQPPRQTTETFSYNIYEPGTNLQNPPVSALSDTLQITLSPSPAVAGAFGQLVFLSGPLDETTPLTPLSNAFSMTETGFLQDLLVPGIPHPTDLSVFGFQSDLDATSVPEPLSLFLFGAGLAGMAVIGRKNGREEI